MLMATSLLANNFDGKIIIKVTNHEHYLPDSLSKQLFDTYVFYKDSIDSERKLLFLLTGGGEAYVCQ